MKLSSLLEEESHISPLTIIVLLLLLLIISSLLGAGLIYGLGVWKGMPMDQLLSSITESSSAKDRNFVRGTIIINHISTFILPAIVLSVLLFRKKWMSYLQLEKSPGANNALLGSLFLVAALPLAQVTFWLNKKISLPQWAAAMEDQTTGLVNNLLIADSPYEMWYNLLVIALIPAIGEELIFRGILQQSFIKMFGKAHLGIWITALIFSTIHLQFEGFFPRLLLGAMLGYLFYWTGNLWVPIAAHFANNGIQIIAQYFYQKEMSNYNPDAIDEVNWVVSGISFILVITIGYFLYQSNQRRTIKSP